MVAVLPGDEVLLEGEGDGGLPGAAEAGEPDGAAAEPASHDLAPLRPRDRVLLRVHVRRHRRALKQGRESKKALSIVLAFPPIGKSIARDAECCLLGKFKGGMVRAIQLIPCALPISNFLS